MNRMVFLVGCLAASTIGCQRSRAFVSTQADADKSASVATVNRVSKEASSARAVASTTNAERPRLLLTQERLERARLNVLGGSEVFRKMEADCAEARRTPQPSGYEGWDWGHLVARCALVWRATGRTPYAETAITYLRALLDDRSKPGDGRGGDAVVRHDHGYPIRTHAFYSALGYDWLHDAPGMTSELRAKIVDRLEAWLDWYAQSGYQRDAPISNYFTGYFLALSYAGLAISGDDPRGDEMLRKAEALFDDKIVPRYKKLLAGGDWPEGWQYGDGAAMTMALFVDGQSTALGRERLSDMPWLRDVVRHHAHAVLPDGVTAYVNGDWSSRPARMPSRALDVLSMVLPESEPESAEARFLARRLRVERDEWGWIRLLSDGPNAKAIDPRQGTRSYWAQGTGLVLARSDWGSEATFISLQCGPSVEEADHQHADQGHFEIVRGEDALLTSAADYGAFATINHNTILVDDRGTSLDYSPNQGAWGRDSTIVRYVDADTYVYAEGDFTDAYRPAKLEYGAKRSVLRAERALLFLRPGVVVMYDRVHVTDPSFRVTWAAHSLVEPVVTGTSLLLRKGKSIADVTALLPKRVKVRVVNEPEKRENAKSAYQVNETWAPTFRMELGSAPGKEVRFLTVTQTGGVGFAREPAERIEGSNIDGALIGKGSHGTAIVFPRDETTLPESGAKWNMPTAGRLIVVGLARGQRYAVTARPIESGCALEVKAGEFRAADDGGTLSVNMEGCVVR